MKRFLVIPAIVALALSLAACGAPAPAQQAPAQQAPAQQAPAAQLALPANLTVAQAQPLLGNPEVFWLDVREQSEYDAGHIPGVKLIPTGEVSNRLSEIPKDKPVIVTCRSGNRSSQVTKYLQDQGYANAHNMEGGIVAWQQAGYPVEK